MFGKRAKQLGVDNVAARRSPAPEAGQGYGPGLPRVPSLSGSSRDGREAQQYDDAQVSPARAARPRRVRAVWDTAWAGARSRCWDARTARRAPAALRRRPRPACRCRCG